MDEKDLKELQEFAKMYQAFMATKTVAANNTAQLMHGPTGLFSQSGLNPEVFSAMIQPAGLGAVLPKVATRYTNPQFPILTGQEDDNGTEPDDSCGDPVRAGFKKLCTLTAQFGMLQRGTDTIDPSEIITLLNRGEMTDLRLMGQIQNNNTGFLPNGMPDPNDILNNVVAAQMSAVGTSFIRNLSGQLWTGSIAGATNGWAEFPGLDSQITTGHKDSVTGTLCPGADSDVKDFTYNNVDGTDGKDIVEYISMLEFYVTDVASRTGATCEWVWTMRRELWQELTAIWPTAYNTNRGASVGTIGGNLAIVVDGGDMTAQRDMMRRSMTLDVNGRTYKVVLDDGINEVVNGDVANLNAGEYASDIYFVPLSANGYPVTRLEYLDYRVVSQMLGAVSQLAGKVQFWTNDGAFLWVYRDLPGFCFDIVGRTQQRVVLQTPHYAGRIQNVKYSPLQHLRSHDPDSPYFEDGGVSTRTDLSNNYAVWDGRQ